MKVTSLKLKGIGCFADELTLPIAQLGEAEVVAVCGQNGAGKSTSLECVPGALYRTTPSRGPIAAMANDRESFIELGVETDAKYLVRLLINGVAKNKPTEAYVTDEAGKPLVSGKARDYDAFVEKHFAAPEVFLSSAFAAQNKDGNFLELAPAQRKGLFAKLLGLGRLETLAEAAGEHVRRIEADLAGLRARIGELESRAAAAPAIRSSLEQARISHGEAVFAREAAEKRAAEIRADLDAWKDRAAALERELTEARAAVRQASDRREAAARELAETQRRLAAVSAKRAALEDRLGRRAELEAAARGADEAEAQAEAADAEAKDLRKRSDEERAALVEWRHKDATLNARLDSAERAVAEGRRQRKRDHETAEAALRTAEAAAERLRKVPCGGEGSFSACALIASATAARDSLDELRRKVDEAKLAAESEPPSAEVESIKAEILALGSAPQAADLLPTISMLESKASALRVQARKARDAAAQLAALAEVEAQAEACDNEAAELRQAVTARQSAVADADAAVKAAGAGLASAQAALADHGKRQPAGVDERQLSALRQAETVAAAQVARLEADLANAEGAEAAAAEVRAELGAVNADLDDWKHLQTALGKSGVQALEIDAAGPEVSALTNELLHACYGPRFSVSLETTQLKADGKGTKEVFDLRVIDSERGIEGSADQLSGGEKVLVSEALSLAIAIYNTRRSSLPLLTLFRDECSGALSAGNALRYVEMLRRAIQLGGFHRCYFISHVPALWDLADARLWFHDGTCEIADTYPLLGHLNAAAENDEAEAA
jgi:exonuclease SbcC